MKTPFLLRMPIELRKALEEEAKGLGITLTALILQILGRYVRGSM
ncbi:hypothetical protein TAMA11512_13120 [Selenomonas sp. TAMA-11512]|nr:hypothetical protein TAMA11512_13120 [Selenomonas sp. TAMA-11512]